MKKANRNWMLILGLAGSLALPGMAMADSWNRAPQKFAGQHVQQRYDRYHRDGDHRYHARREHREWREHREHRRYDRDAYRWHEWREHEWREHARYRGYRVYPRVHWSGFFVYPSAGLVLNLR